MDDATVFALAKQAEFYTAVTYNELIRFAALVAAHERERILEMCREGWWDGEGIRYHLEKQDVIRSRK